MTKDREKIRFAFHTHGLGDCVHCATAMRLYIDRGYDVAVQIEPNKRWIWEAAGIPIWEKSNPEDPDLPLHPYYYPDDFFNLSKPDYLQSKIAHLFEVDVLPKLGNKEEVWQMVCNQQIKATVSPQALQEAQQFLEGLPKPVVLFHSKGTNWQERKSIPDLTAFQFLREMIESFGGSIIVLDWDSRAPSLCHERIRGIKPTWGHISAEQFSALCTLSDLMIGVDSGPFHLAQWTGIKSLYVTHDIAPVRCCLPHPNSTYLVPAKHHEHWVSRGSEWKFAEYQGSEVSVRDLVITACQLLSPSPRNTQLNRIDPPSVVGKYTYHRVGYDERSMELQPGGTIGDGAGGCERRWSVEMTPLGQSLVISGDNGNPPCHLSKGVDGVYRGFWTHHERMPIELIPTQQTDRDARDPDTVRWSDLVPVDVPDSTDSPVIQYRKHEYGYTSLAEFRRQCVCLARSLPPVKAIAGVPRSGILAATLIAMELNCPIIPLESLLNETLPEVPSIRRIGRGYAAGADGIYLVVDDTCASGRMIGKIRPNLHRDVRIAVIQGSYDHADFCGRPFDLELHQSFEWTLLHDSNAEYTLCDLDGVLCEDWNGDETQNEGAYGRHVYTASPLRIPTYPLLAIVTNRLERWRSGTEEWLARHNVQYEKLIMSPHSTAAERDREPVASRKAVVYQSYPEARLFVESCSRQAREIARFTSRPVFSVEDNALV